MATTIKTPRDPNTLSNYHNWTIKHTIATFDINFEERKLSGHVVLQLKARNVDERPPVVLDTSWLDIGSVKINGVKTNHELISRLEPYGSALKIPIDSDRHTADVDLDVRLTPLRRLQEDDELMPGRI